MEYYTAFKKKEIPVTFNMHKPWGYYVKLVSHKRTNIALFHSHEMSKAVKITKTESKKVVAKDGERGEGELVCFWT